MLLMATAAVADSNVCADETCVKGNSMLVSKTVLHTVKEAATIPFARLFSIKYGDNMGATAKKVHDKMNKEVQEGSVNGLVSKYAFWKSSEVFVGAMAFNSEENWEFYEQLVQKRYYGELEPMMEPKVFYDGGKAGYRYDTQGPLTFQHITSTPCIGNKSSTSLPTSTASHLRVFAMTFPDDNLKEAEKEVATLEREIKKNEILGLQLAWGFWNAKDGVKKDTYAMALFFKDQLAVNAFEKSAQTKYLKKLGPMMKGEYPFFDEAQLQEQYTPLGVIPASLLQTSQC